MERAPRNEHKTIAFLLRITLGSLLTAAEWLVDRLPKGGRDE